MHTVSVPRSLVAVQLQADYTTVGVGVRTAPHARINAVVHYRLSIAVERIGKRVGQLPPPLGARLACKRLPVRAATADRFGPWPRPRYRADEGRAGTGSLACSWSWLSIGSRSDGIRKW